MKAKLAQRIHDSTVISLIIGVSLILLIGLLNWRIGGDVVSDVAHVYLVVSISLLIASAITISLFHAAESSRKDNNRYDSFELLVRGFVASSGYVASAILLVILIESAANVIL